MKLNNNINYIVSGTERSGTSLMMQLLDKGEVPIAYDTKRKPDINNPRVYYELEGGKIIKKIIDNTFDFDKYTGKFIKITAYGLQYLPVYEYKRYKIIYMYRNIDEIVESMNKMSDKTFDSYETKELLIKLKISAIDTMRLREDIEYKIISYNGLLKDHNNPNELDNIKYFLPDFNVNEAKKVIDEKLYRNRK